MEEFDIKKILKKFNIKPCHVNLTNTEFSKIRIACSAHSSEPNLKLSCDLKQENVNTFTLKITRTSSDDNGLGMTDVGQNLKRMYCVLIILYYFNNHKLFVFC